MTYFRKVENSPFLSRVKNGGISWLERHFAPTIMVTLEHMISSASECDPGYFWSTSK